MSATALAGLLRHPRFEVLPLDGVEEEVRAHLEPGTKVTVTASPRIGLEETLGLSERLARASASCSSRRATPPSRGTSTARSTC